MGDKMKLDLGCGEAKRADWLGLDVRRVKGVDVVGDAMHLPFQSCVFDSCIALAVLEHVDNPLLTLTEINRVLKLEASLKVLVPKHSMMWLYRIKLLLLLRWKYLWAVTKSLNEGSHKWQYSKKGLVKLLEIARFGMLELHTEGLPFGGVMIATAVKESRGVPE